MSNKTDSSKLHGCGRRLFLRTIGGLDPKVCGIVFVCIEDVAGIIVVIVVEFNSEFEVGFVAVAVDWEIGLVAAETEAVAAPTCECSCVPLTPHNNVVGPPLPPILLLPFIVIGSWCVDVLRGGVLVLLAPAVGAPGR